MDLNSSSLTFNDEALSPISKNKIDKINVNLQNIDTKKQSLLNYTLSMRINEGGYVKSKGDISLSPLEQNGTITLEKISLKELTPYIQKSAFVKIDKGYLNLKANTNYAPSAKTADLSVDESLNVEDFYLSDNRDKSKLFSFSDVALKSFEYKISPDTFFINQIDINLFYLSTIIYKNKSLNLSSLMKNEKKISKSSTTKSKTDDLFPVKINKIKVSNGRAYFADLSLPINFKTNIHSINGVIFPVSTTKNIKSHINLRGKVDKYGSTKLKGSINSSNPKKIYQSQS